MMGPIELELIEWQHPVHGWVSEVACSGHRNDVLRALRMLGIGCGGTTASADAACVRCAAGSTDPRRWIRSLASGVKRNERES